MGHEPRETSRGELDAAARRCEEQIRAAQEANGHRADGDRYQAVADRETRDEHEARDQADVDGTGSAAEEEADLHRNEAVTAQAEADRHESMVGGVDLDPEQDYDTNARRDATADRLNGQHPRNAARGADKAKAGRRAT